MRVDAFAMEIQPEAAVEAVRGREARLLLRARNGDLEAFEKLMRLHEHRVLRTARRLLCCRDEANDAAQETFLRLYRYLDRLDADRPLTPWLYRVTVNVCRDLGRRRKRRPGLDLDDLTAAQQPVARDAGSDPAAGVHHAQQRRLLWRFLRQLPERQRAALVLRELEGLSTREVARVLRTSQTTVRSQVSRARLKLRQVYRDLREVGDASL